MNDVTLPYTPKELYMYARHMVWDAIKFAFRRFFGFWLSVIPRMIITFFATAIVSCAIVGGLYFLAKMLHLIPAPWLEFAFIFALILALIVPMISISIVWLRVALGKSNNQPVPLWVTPIVKPTIMIFFSSIFAALCVIVGFVLLVVPGIFISLRLCLATFCIIDHGHGPIKSLKCSWSITRDAKSDIWKLSFILAIFLIALIGVRIWMGLPIQNYTETTATITAFAKNGVFNISRTQIIYNIIVMVSASLWTLSMAHLYTKLSQKES